MSRWNGYKKILVFETKLELGLTNTKQSTDHYTMMFSQHSSTFHCTP